MLIGAAMRPGGAQGFRSLFCRTDCAVTCICSEKSSAVSGEGALTGMQAGTSIAPKAWLPGKFLNQYNFCASVLQPALNGARSASTGNWAVPWQLRQPEMGLSTGPLARPAQPRWSAAYFGIWSEMVVWVSFFPAC